MQIWSLRRYLLPFILLTIVFFEYSGLLHISYIHIKSHELKWTDLSLNYFPREGDLFTSGEVVTQNNYEDAVFAFSPDYNRLLEKDLAEIAQNRNYIDRIDKEELAFYSGPYRIQACLDKKDIEIKDSTLFRKIVDVEILGNYELYDVENGRVLYEQKHSKFWIRDQIVIRGRSRKPFIRNKVNEIWLAQISNNAQKIVEQYEQPALVLSELSATDFNQEDLLSSISTQEIHQYFIERMKEEHEGFRKDDTRQ